MRFSILASGSRANCVLVNSGGTYLLVDCGLSRNQIVDHLAELEIKVHDLAGVLISHEHSDHWGCVESFAKIYGLKVYLTFGSAKARELNSITAVFDALAALAYISPRTVPILLVTALTLAS